MSILDLHLGQRLATRFQRRLERGPSDDLVHGVTARGERAKAPPRTAWVLLGGGSRGAAQAGALTVLLEAGIVPDMIVAISAGAWNGVYLALDPTVERAHELEQAWLNTTTHDIIGGPQWYSALHVIRHHLSVYDGAGMRRVADYYIAGRDFADLHVPLRVIATDLISGRPHIFSSGPLLPAVVASSSVPGVFPPVPCEHELLVDGGINEWAACALALEMGATRICLPACGFHVPKRNTLHSFMQVLERSMDVGLCDSFNRTLFALHAIGVDVLPIFPETPNCSFLDFSHAAELIACGREAASRALAAGWNPERGAWSGERAAVLESAAAVQHAQRSA